MYVMGIAILVSKEALNHGLSGLSNTYIFLPA
jgi:hypothetical protein